MVSEVDISPVEKAIQRKDARRQRPYDPRMMVALLVYAYCTGVHSSRRMERACQENVAFRVITGNRQPYFTTINEFRRMHRKRFEGLFVEVLRLCREAGRGAEWALVCMCHNLLKMFRNRPKEAPAAPARSAAAPLAREERSEASAVRLGVLLLCLSRPAGILVSSPHTQNRYRNQPGSANPGPPAPVNPAQQLQPPSHLRPGKRLRRTDS